MLDMKKALTKLMKAPIVTQVGSSGRWQYRKWSNGMVEAWATITKGSMTGVSLASPIYHTEQTIDFPSGLFSSEPRVYITTNNSNYWWMGGTYNGSATGFKFRAFKATSASQELAVRVYAILIP